jgi:hypothetical protein
MPEAEYLALPEAKPYEFPVQRPDIPDYANTGDEAEREQWTKLYENENHQCSEAHSCIFCSSIAADGLMYFNLLSPIFTIQI